ncbi:ankyrin-1-like [Mytilus edulis]|uniref:ankyrin-1-like n=1 Tax=Mytilus edulis TaxID=6550 RepID=UPI0039F0A8BB
MAESSAPPSHGNISVLSSEEINYLRLSNLILRVAPTAVKTKFDYEFHPTVLQRVLNQNKMKVIEPLYKQRIINKTQWDLLFPVSGSACSTEFDLTLMICLIRNLTTISIGDALPVASDTSQGADLSRLKHYRNKIVHCGVGILSDKEFEECWTEISQAIIRLGGTRFEQRCSDLKISIMNNTDKEILKELRNIERSSDPVPKGVRRINGELIEDWEKGNVAETRAIKRIAELIETQNFVVAVGSSGCGKSTSIHYVALQLYHQQGFDIIPVYNPEEVRQYYNPDCKQVYVIDDICGKSTIDINLVNCWERQLTEIQKILKVQRVKLLSSCRTHIFKNRLFKKLSSLFAISCDLTSDYGLTRDERKAIASIYLTNDEIKLIHGTALTEKFDFFPLLCSIFSTQKLSNIRDFFNNPVQVFRHELTLLMNADDQKTIATLMLFTVYNNTINETLLSRTSSITQVLETISDNFHLQQCFSIQCIKTELDNLNRSYVKKIGQIYRVQHDKLYEILVIFLGEHKFDVLLDVAHTNIIRDMFLLKPSHETENDSVDHVITFVEVSKKNEPSYFNRLIRDINDGFVKNVLNNKQMKHFSFRNKILKKIKSESNIIRELKSLSRSDLSSLFISMIHLGFCEMVSILIDNFDLNIIPENALYIASDLGSTSIVKLLLDRGINPNECISKQNGVKKTPIFVASKNGYTEIVKLLLENGSDASMNFWRRVKNTPLYVASKGGYIDIVKLLLNYGADPNIPLMHFGIPESPLYAAIDNEHSEVVKILLDHKADPSIKGWDDTPLYLAVKKRNSEIVKSLLIQKADPNYVSDNKKPPLYMASENGDTEIVKLFLNFKGNSNIRCHGDKKSPLHIAIEKNHIEVVCLLISHNANPFAVDTENITPMFIALDHGNIAACRLLAATKKTITVDTEYMLSIILYLASKYGKTGVVKSMLEQTNVDGDDNTHNEYKLTPLGVASLVGNKEVVTTLLDYRCNPNIANMYKETSLFTASQFGRTDIVQLLLNAYANPNKYNKNNLTPVYTALMLGHIKIVKILLENNSDINITDKYHEPLVFVAASKGHTEIVKLLLDSGCDPCVCNKFNTTALHEASYQGHSETVKVLLEKNSNPCIIDMENDSPLTETFAGQMKRVELIKKHKADPSFLSWYQKTPLCIATYLGHTETVKLLLQYNTDSTFKNKIFLKTNNNRHMSWFIQTPLLHATWAGYIDIVKLYLEHSWDPNVSNSDNQTPLYIAACINNTEAAKILLEYEGNPYIYSKDKKTPLFVASANGYNKIVKLLLEHNCNPNFIDSHGTTAIYKASEKGHVDTVKLLLEYKSDPNICNEFGETPLHVSALNGSIEIVKLLLASKCNENKFNTRNETPVDMAKRGGHTDILTLLQNSNTAAK